MTTPPDDRPRSPRGRPFRQGYDPNRFTGAPGVGGQKPGAFRVACLEGAEKGLPKILALLESEDPYVVMRAWEGLCKYAGLLIATLDARLEHALTPGQGVVFYLPDNGRNQNPRAVITSLPPAEVPAELDDDGEPLPEGVYRWRDGSLMSFPEP